MRCQCASASTGAGLLSDRADLDSTAYHAIGVRRHPNDRPIETRFPDSGTNRGIRRSSGSILPFTPRIVRSLTASIRQPLAPRLIRARTNRGRGLRIRSAVCTSKEVFDPRRFMSMALRRGPSTIASFPTSCRAQGRPRQRPISPARTGGVCNHSSRLSSPCRQEAPERRNGFSRAVGNCICSLARRGLIHLRSCSMAPAMFTLLAVTFRRTASPM
jgi:hypothetical protein